MSSKEYTIAETDAWRLYKLLEELDRFLHSPRRLADAEAVAAWLRNRSAALRIGG